MIHDVLIVGGGLIGISLARALTSANVDLSVALVDSVSAKAAQHPSYDDRAIALSAGSMRILAGLGVAARLEPLAAPIASVHVSDRGHFGFTRLEAARFELDALGYVVDARTLGNVLTDVLANTGAVKQYVPAELVALDYSSDCITVHLQHPDGARQESVVRTKLLVAADGSRSRVRELLGIEFAQRDYRQSAITANLSTSIPHRGVAYERFTHTGPMAMLPMTGERCGLIWTLPTAAANDIAQLSDTAFAEAFCAHFGRRLGRVIKIGERSVYPLNSVRAREQIRPRAVLVGNASQTLHPVAGQGLNLGLRDVAALAETLVDAYRDGLDVGDVDRLQTYQAWRRRDQRTITGFTDKVVRLFSSDFLPINLGRSLGLVLLDVVPPLKRQFVARATGLAGRQSRLARGVTL